MLLHSEWCRCQRDGVTTYSGHPRAATADDGLKLLRLWARLFDEDDSAAHEPWRTHAREWFDRFVDDANAARFPVIEVNGDIVATAIGTLEIGVPSPHVPRDVPCDLRTSSPCLSTKAMATGRRSFSM